MIPSAAPNRLIAPISQNSVPNQAPTLSLSTLPSSWMKSKLSVLDGRVAVDRRVGDEREDDDRDRADHEEREELLDVGLAPPVPPAGHVLLVGREHVALPRVGRLLGAGDGGDHARRVLAHPVALVADPVAQHQVVGPARARVRESAEQDGPARGRRSVKLPKLGDDLVGVRPAGRGDGGGEGDHQEDEHERDLAELELLDRLVDDRRGRQRDPDQRTARRWRSRWRRRRRSGRW